jgi:hypothetical protein
MSLRALTLVRRRPHCRKCGEVGHYAKSCFRRRVVDGVVQWRCCTCGHWFDKSGFYTTKKGNRLTRDCRTCHNHPPESPSVVCIPPDSVPHAYLAGVLHGDAYLIQGNRTLGLHVKDYDFMRAFTSAIQSAFGIEAQVHLERGRYWYARVRREGLFGSLRSMRPSTDAGRGAWLRGFFDSEGNANICYRPSISPEAYIRRVKMYSTNARTLGKARAMLRSLGIPATIRPSHRKKQKNHYGTKTVYELVLSNSKETFARFLNCVGTSIDRKRLVLEKIVSTYQNRQEYCSRGGRRGCATKWGKPCAD